MILNPWRTLPFIAQLHLQPPKIRFVLPLKTPRSNLVVFHMREEKFFIIRPTKADNLHKQSLDPILVSIGTHASIFNSTKIWLTLENEVCCPKIWFPRPEPRPWPRARSRVLFCCERPRPEPAGQVARVIFGRGLTPRLRPRVLFCSAPKQPSQYMS